MTLDEIEVAVAGFDAALRPIGTRPVGFNDPDWQAKLSAGPAPLDEAGIRPQAEATLRALLEIYADGDADTRAAVRALFDRYTYFRWAAHLAFVPTPEGFRWRLVHLSARDQGADMRDEMMTLQSVVADALAAGVDLVPILLEVAAISSDVDRYGMGSVQGLLTMAAERARRQ